MSGNWITDSRRWAIYARDGFACVYCGVSKADGAVLTLDHVKPRSAGGSHKNSNLVTCCVHCNSARSDMSLAAFAEYLRVLGVPAPVVSGLRASVRAALARPVDLAKGKALASGAKAGRTWGFSKYLKG